MSHVHLTTQRAAIFLCCATALKKCPSLVLVHVDLIDDARHVHVDPGPIRATSGEKSHPLPPNPVVRLVPSRDSDDEHVVDNIAPEPHPTHQLASATTGHADPVHREDAAATAPTLPTPLYAETASRNSAKVSLERYRLFSQRVVAIYASVADHVERASVDECYLDLTAAVAKRLRPHLLEKNSGALLDDTTWQWHGDVYGGSFALPPLSLQVGGGTTSFDLDTQLCVGSAIVDELRERVRRECGITTSAGISVNKVFAFTRLVLFSS